MSQSFDHRGLNSNCSVITDEKCGQISSWDENGSQF